MFVDRGDPRLPGESQLCVLQSGGRGQPRSVEAVRTSSFALDAVHFVILFVRC